MTLVTVSVNSKGPPGTALPVPEGGYARWVTPGGWIRCPGVLLLDQASVVAGASVVASVIRKNLDLDPGRLGIEPIPGIEPTVMMSHMK